MRLSNKRKVPIFNFVFNLLVLFLIVGILAFFIEKYKLDFLGWESIFFIIIPFFLLVLFWLIGNQIFEYDSDGEALNFNNYGIIPFFKNAKRDEFPKYKLLKYEVINLFLVKRLYITISSKKSHSLILKYDVSYLNNKDIKDLKFSLQKVLKSNSKNPNMPDFS